MVFGTGLLALDVIVNAEVSEDPVLAAGGTCGNVLTALSFLGWKSFPVARLNGDTASRLLQEDLSQWQVSLDFATEVPAAATPIILQTIRRSANGPTHSFSLVCPSCRSWFPRFKAVRRESASAVLSRLGDSEPTPKAQVFFFDRVSRSALMLAERFAADGAVVVFEPSGGAKSPLFEEALSVAHVLKYSSQRMPNLGERASNSGNCLLEIETRGTHGLRYRSALTSWAWHTRRAIEGPSTVDSAGAGDWCTAGLLAVLAGQGLQGLSSATDSDLQEALEFGQAAAAIACSYAGARGVMYALEAEQFRTAANELLNQSAGRRQLVDLKQKTPSSQGLCSLRIPEVCPSCS